MSPRHLAPAPEVDEQAIAAFAEQQGWVPGDTYPATDETPYERVWLTAEGDGGLHYVEDQRTSVNYVTAVGEQAEVMLVTVADGLHMLTLPELREAFDSATTDNQALMAVVRAGVSAPPQVDEGYLRLLVDGMRHEAAEVRLLAVTAAGYPRWPELKAPLEEVVATDADEDVRDTAEALLEMLGEG